MRPLAPDFPISDRPRFAPWIVFLGAFLIPLIYLPTLGTRFDFIDDGNLVYPAPPMPLGERLGLVWQKIAANYEHLGPFRLGFLEALVRIADWRASARYTSPGGGA